MFQWYNDATTIILKRGVLLKIGLLLTHEIYQELEKRGHYLGISKTSTVLLHLVFYATQFKEVTKEELENELDKIEVSHQQLQVEISDVILLKYDNRKMYLLTVRKYLSAYLSYVVNHTNWKSEEKSVFKAVSTTCLSQETVNQLALFKEQTGIPNTALLNYAFTLDYSAPSAEWVSKESDRVQQGIQLTKSSSKRIQELSDETGYPRNIVLEQQLIKLLENIVK
ncbi:hypothetical protein [Carnobacterium inhibens]|uniref:Uncharacterized protein n=1 Tax=Carnobacterium inhibens TaxID=147709 RepID=A0ABR7TFE5_9LACT|nr:hypothetical protein [Carnobacterium inhibens]MBC9826135.1 hypothetical protein [Carnobacterium inhibens]